MSLIYTPILKAKKGEFNALSHLSERAKNQIIPLFDIPIIKEEKEGIESSLHKTANNIEKVWASHSSHDEQKSIFIDFPRWIPNAQTENGEHVIPYLCNRLEQLNIQVNPVVRYDCWEDSIYMNAIKGMRLKKGNNFCIRLDMDSDTVADIKADPDHVTEQLSKIIEQLELNPSEIYLLIDFGDISKQSRCIENVFDEAKQTISLVQKYGFSKIMLAGASLPISIDLAVNQRDSTGLVLRKEMMVWQMLLSEHPDLNIIFADYGVQNPSSSDESKPYPHANGKIRYTINNQCFIARGHPLNTGLKYSQFRNLAKTVVDSGHFLSEQFSWGDRQIILRKNPESATGNLTTWISIDTNHHIETVVMEVMEFNRQLAFIQKRKEHS